MPWISLWPRLRRCRILLTTALPNEIVNEVLMTYSMEKLPEWITAISGVINALGIGLLYWQLRADHNRSRRERAVEIIGDWAKHRSERNPLIVSAALSCTDEQATLAYKKESITLQP